MFEYYRLNRFGTIVRLNGDFAFTFDKDADFWFADNSNAYHAGVNGIDPSDKITEGEAFSFTQRFRR